ncbi:hypothetical protein F5B22DRAFT_604323 [Xylaria bambusicola]|uniref:uncharacterized protein n=1 Tax=Xylaria bambusicola TaxID=326684 RepID=UPI0020075F04|nr:uncharacterized protein F5B22DRAFT_604323 [Xylaria bambusicola]KAI0517364.1 hypothetical protein F5B22DRAFT_604323 [Xylaria bambusicola]
MADADYFLDLSSPDPLADEVPSSVRPASRRITKSQHDLSAFSIPQSSPRRGSRAQSPRKRTFQLDVGDERSPQRIRVTVEAEDGLKQSAVNRTLFPPPASPTRSPRRRETITTTTVPLNDEPNPVGGGVGTPQKRGRPRRISNGTPMPRGRKRAGTPIQRSSKQVRQEYEPSSETGISNDASADVNGDGGEATPKPKTRTRKTPRKLAGNTPVPSSQASSKATGRKRGRPRKVPISEEPGVLTGASAQTTNATILDLPPSEANIEDGTDKSRNLEEAEGPRGHVSDNNVHPTPSLPKQRAGTISPPQNPSQDHTRIERSSVSPTSSHQLAAENDDFMMMSEDYQGAEAHSDLQSTDDEDGITHHGQDTIADASDFSMIAVESLPSFQASFRASLQEDTTKLASDHYEMGEQTSHIINQTLESLRHSLRTGTEIASHASEAQDDTQRTEDRGEVEEVQEETSATANQEDRRGLLSSPRRPKQLLPLSRQVFVGRGGVDDSFSTIPDSILHAATPRRLPAKTTDSEYESQARQADTYNDSFSEIPEAVLEAATPRPARRVESSPHISMEGNEDRHQITRPPARRASPDYGSNRLPTPEDTSSSNGGSRKAHEEDAGAALEPQDQSGSVHHPDVPSSPPIRTRPRALDFGYSNLQNELSTVQEKQSSSPQRQPYGKIAPSQLHSLEAPHRTSRPSLSPIVRVGRTLQNVMSDNSSPDNREANLGSPFRGSASSDHLHQSLVPGSSSPSIRAQKASNNSQFLTGSSSRLGRSFRSNLNQNSGHVSQVSDKVAHSIMPENGASSRIEQLKDLTERHSPEALALSQTSFMSRPAEKVAADLGEEAHRATQGHSAPQTSRQELSSRAASSVEADVVETHGTGLSYGATADLGTYMERDQNLCNELAQHTDEDLNDRFDDHVGDDEYDGDDIDVWDIEASRASPGKPESALTTSGPTRKPDVPSSRRSKVPSPWRRNNRRLIYKDDIASSSQIEIETSSQSDIEQNLTIPPTQGPSVSQSQQDTQTRVADLEPVHPDSMPEDIQMLDSNTSPSPSHGGFEDYAGLADSDEPDDIDEIEAPVISGQTQRSPNPMHEELQEWGNHEEPQELERSQALDMPPTFETSMNASEYSMVAQQAKQTPQEQKKPAPTKSGFFGGFDILSFFSSPAVLPTNKSGSKPPESINKAVVPQPSLGTKQQKEPPKAFWSTGLFPTMPRKEAGPIARRRMDQSSPGPALRSTDTVADTYEPSTSASPSPSRSRTTSAAPSTPERQMFPPIEQKRNFTPRPGQMKGSLFTSRQSNHSAVQREASSDFEESSEEQESSALTESSEYERVPPSEKPSQWDRNLSPTKSCFRSPLKPTTPGRIVAFSNSALGPLAQVQPGNIMHNSTNAHNTISQGPPLRPAFEGKENQQYPHTQQIKSANNNSVDKTNSDRSTVSRDYQQPLRPKVLTKTMSFALSQMEWTKQHWCRLDEMLQLRRRDPLRFQQACPLPPRDRRRSTALVGKEVSAQDARLILEPWHLEIVEAFKLEVGGWDERVLAKRLFALIIGEEKRRAGAVR